MTRAENGTPIVGATVNVPGFYNRTVTTDGSGNYSFPLPGGAQTVIVSFSGYNSDTASVAIVDATTTTHNVALINAATGVVGSVAGGAAVSLSEAKPNPTRGPAAVDLVLPRVADVRVSVFDLSGRRVRTLADGAMPAGLHRVSWDGADADGRPVAAGTYLYRLEAAGETRTTKVTVVR